MLYPNELCVNHHGQKHLFDFSQLSNGIHKQDSTLAGQTFSGSDFSLNGKFVSKGLQPRLLKGEDEALFDFLFEEQWTCKLVTVLSIYKTSVVYKLYLDKDMDLDESREVQSHVNLTFYPKDRWPLKKKKKT